ncbi:hypothetical protein, partial [Bacillus sp. EB600]|uniref:hypothetical protein n=1 Tax=Bacillus sp. EB600 TaxID=2806345 RepID=UPI00210870FC
HDIRLFLMRTRSVRLFFIIRAYLQFIPEQSCRFNLVTIMKKDCYRNSPFVVKVKHPPQSRW